MSFCFNLNDLKVVWSNLKVKGGPREQSILSYVQISIAMDPRAASPTGCCCFTGASNHAIGGAHILS